MDILKGNTKPWIFRRLLQMVIVLFGTSVLSFILTTLAPGDAVNKYAGPDVSEQRLEEIRRQYGLDQSVAVQYFRWLCMSVKGHLGYSITKHRSVAGILKESIPETLKLSLAALIFNLMLGTIAGIIAGTRSNKISGRLINTASIVLISIPVFWLALVCVYIFNLKLGWTPPLSFSSESLSFLEKLLRIARVYGLPVLILGTAGAAATCRFVRENLMATLNQPYCVQARAAGLPESKVIIRYALRNALLPLITQTGLILPFLLGGSFIIEVIFSIPGMGRITYEAIFARDVSVILAVNMLSAVMVVLGSSISDILYRVADPRITLKY